MDCIYKLTSSLNIVPSTADQPVCKRLSQDAINILYTSWRKKIKKLTEKSQSAEAVSRVYNPTMARFLLAFNFSEV